MNLKLLAHEGEVHETEAEETAHAAQTGTVTLPLDVVVGAGTVLVILLFWVLATRIFKLTFAVKVLVVMTALLIVGVAGYQIAPVTSIIALSAGFALALTSVFVQLMAGRRRPK